MWGESCRCGRSRSTARPAAHPDSPMPTPNFHSMNPLSAHGQGAGTRLLACHSFGLPSFWLRLKSRIRQFADKLVLNFFDVHRVAHVHQTEGRVPELENSPFERGRRPRRSSLLRTHYKFLKNLRRIPRTRRKLPPRRKNYHFFHGKFNSSLNNLPPKNIPRPPQPATS